MKGSIRKHSAKDGTTTYRVRVEIRDPQTGRRSQPQRTYKTKREAEAGLARWLVELEPDRIPGIHWRRGESLPPWAQQRGDVPPGLAACLREIARIAAELQWCRQDLSRDHVTRLLQAIEGHALAGLDYLLPDEARMPSAVTATQPEEPDRRFHVYRLLSDGVPIYVGQSRNVPLRVRDHMSRATGTQQGRSACTRAIREALASGKAISYDIVASAPTAQDIVALEREWIVRMLAEGHPLGNSG